MIYEPDPLFDAPQDPPAVQGPPPPPMVALPPVAPPQLPPPSPEAVALLNTPSGVEAGYAYPDLLQFAQRIGYETPEQMMYAPGAAGITRYLMRAPDDARLWTDDAGTLRHTEDTWSNIGRAFTDGLYTDNALGMIYARERHGSATEADLEYARQMESRRPIPDHWYNNVARIAGNVAFYGGTALAGAGMGLVASPAGGAFGAAAAPILAPNLISGGHLYPRMRKAGVPHDTAYAMSLIGGAGTSALEYIGGKWLSQAATRVIMRDVAKEAAEQLVGAPRLFHSGPIAQRLMSGLAASAQEAGTEGAQNLWEDAVNAASIVGTRPKNWFELEPEDKAKYVTLFDSMEKLGESLSEAADVAWMTMYSMGLGTSVATTGYTATMMLSNEERIRRGKQNKDLLERVASIKKGSKVAQQGGKFEQALQAQAEEYGGETAYMDRLRAKKVLAEADKAAVEAAKAAGQTPASQTPATDLVAAQMPELVKQLNDESVTTVAVPTAALADKLGASEVGIALTQEVTLDPDDMPVAFEEALKELQKLQTRKIEERAEAEDAWGTSFEEAMAKFEETNAEALAKLPRATRYALTYSVRGWLVASATEGVMPLDVYNHLPVDVNVMARAQPAIAPVPSLTGFTHPLWRTLDDAQRTKLMGTKILTGGVLESAGDNLGPAVVYRLLGNHTMGENTFIVGEPQLEAGGGVSAAFVDVRNPFVEGQTVFAPDVLADLVATVRANEAKAASDIESDAAVQLRAQQRKQGKRPKKRKIEPVQLSESLLTNAVDTFDGLVRAFGGGLDLNTEEGRVLAEQRAIDFLAKHKFDAVLDADIGTVRVVKKSQIVGEQVFTEQKHFDQYFPKSEGARVTSTAATYDWDNAQVTVHHLNNPIATMHEMMHHITSYLEQVTKVPNKLGTTQAHQMWQSLLKSWKTTQAKYDAADGDKKAKWIEQTAYQFEVYLTTGKPPAPQFKSLFRFLKRWATALVWGAQNDYADSRRAMYEKVYGRKLPVVSKELTQVFDILMGAETGVQQMEASRNIEQIAESAEELAEIVGENPNLPSVKVPPIKEDTYQAALDLLPGVTELTPSSLQRMLGIGSVTARRIWNRLAKEGYLTETVQGTRTVVRPLLRSDVLEDWPTYPDKQYIAVEYFFDARRDDMEFNARVGVGKLADTDDGYWLHLEVPANTVANPEEKYHTVTQQQLRQMPVSRMLDASVIYNPDSDVSVAAKEAWPGVELTVPPRVLPFTDPARQTNFKKWFGDSKVVDADGKPLRVYHGTAAPEFKRFMRKRQYHTTSAGLYFTSSPAVASTYAGTDASYARGRLVPSYLRMENPLVVNQPDAIWSELRPPSELETQVRRRYGGLPDLTTDTIVELAEEAGYDGVIFQNIFDAAGHTGDSNHLADVYVVFKDTQVKSAIGNTGRYSLSDGNILRSDVAPAVDAAFDEYQTLSEEVREELKEEVTADGMKVMSWYRNARERLTREVLRKPAQAKLEKLQLEEWMRRRLRPVHRARHFFRTKEFLNEQGEAVPVQFGRMNTESVRKLTDPRTFKLLTNTAVSARGADPVLVAKMFGYDNVAEFLHDLAHAPTAKEEVLQAAGDRLKAENPELVEGTKEADIRLDELMHSELRGRKYALELKLLGKLKVEHADLHAAAKHQATGIVRGRLVGDIDAKRGTAPLHKVFQAEENKAALEVNNALAGKPNPQPGQGPQRGKRPPRDLNRAIDAKSRQLAAHERARAALAARTDIRTRMARMQKLLGRSSDSLASGHSMHLITFARDLAARVGLNIGKREGNGHRITAARLYAEQHFSELAFVSDEIVRLITNAGMLRDSLDGRLVRDLTYAEFDEVMTVLEGLTELARAERKEGRADRKEILDQQAAEFVDHYETWAEKHGANVAPGSEGTITFAQTVLNKLAEFRTSLTKMLAWCVRMDGDLKDGPFTRYIWDPISKADQAARHRNHVIQERLRDIVEPLRSKLTGDPIVAHELNGYVFRGRFEIFGLLMHMGNDSNKFKVVRGGRGTDVPPWFDSITAGVPDTGRVDKFMQRMIYEGVIDEQMLDAAQAIGDLYAELLPETQAAHYAVHGTTFPIVELRPFTITFRDGTQKEYRGWYTPARTDTNLHTHLTGTPSTRMDEEFLNSLPSVNSTWAIERSPTAKQPLTLDPDLLFTHMAEMVNYIHLQPALKGVNSLLLRDDVQRVIRRRDRQALDKLIWPWLDRVAKQQVFTPKDNALDQSVDWLRRRASLMLMSVNFVNALQNAVNPSPLLGVGVKHGTLANTFLRMVRQPRAMEQFAIQSSAFVNQRLESYSHLLHEQIKGSMKPGFWSQLSNARRWFQEKVAYRAQIWTQRWTDLIGWHAVYNQQLTDGASHEEAVAQADKMLQMVVGSFNPIDSTAFNSKSAVHHASAQFGDYFVTLANATATALNVKAHRGAGFAELAQTGVWMWIAPMVVGEMISKGFRGLDDEEYDYDSALANYSMALARETLLAPLRGAMQAVPLFGQMSQAALNHLVTEDAYDDRMRLPPAASLAVDLADMAGKLLTLEVDSSYFDNLLQLSSAAAGFAVPRQLPYLIKLGTGEKPMPDTIMETAAGIVAGGRRASF